MQLRVCPRMQIQYKFNKWNDLNIEMKELINCCASVTLCRIFLIVISFICRMKHADNLKIYHVLRPFEVDCCFCFFSYHPRSLSCSFAAFRFVFCTKSFNSHLSITLALSYVMFSICKVANHAMDFDVRCLSTHFCCLSCVQLFCCAIFQMEHFLSYPYKSIQFNDELRVPLTVECIPVWILYE